MFHARFNDNHLSYKNKSNAHSYNNLEKYKIAVKVMNHTENILFDFLCMQCSIRQLPHHHQKLEHCFEVFLIVFFATFLYVMQKFDRNKSVSSSRKSLDRCITTVTTPNFNLVMS